MRRILIATFSVVLGMAVALEMSEEPAGCVGATPCRACRSCRSCAYCAKEGGACGACAPPARPRRAEAVGKGAAIEGAVRGGQEGTIRIGGYALSPRVRV